MRTCARCGADCDREFGQQTRHGVTAFYCDPAAAVDATCFFLAKWAGFPELDL